MQDGAKASRSLSFAQPLQQGRRMHRVGLVIAGQRIHHQIDAEAQRHLALAFTARHRRR